MVTVLDYPEVQRLPTLYAAGIGRVISRWAYLEWLLARVTYQALGVNPKHGRIAVREPRGDEYIKMIQDLLRVRGISVPLPDPDFKKRLEHARKERDHVAHGLWLRHPQTNELRLWFTKESWPTTAGGPSGPRKITPEAIHKTPTDLIATYKEIDALIALARQFEHAIQAALAPSPRKRHARSDPRDPRKASGRSRPRVRRAPSPA